MSALAPSTPATLSPAPIRPRAEIAALSASKIREVANSGIGREDVLAFWFGEPDQVTPAFIREAAAESLGRGETFYTSNLGIAPLREEIAGYVSRLHRPITPDRIAVTSSGVAALKIAAQALMSPGDRVVVVTPVWPNLTEAPQILSARVIRVALDCVDGLWQLDVDKLLTALTPDTRVLVLNSPNNPTGWMITRAQQEIILDHCRKHGIWIVADDVYERMVFDHAVGPFHAAPSFLDIADDQDRVISANSFSKSWLMTGWRLGWLTSPLGKDGATLMDHYGKLIEYNTSCAPGFIQQAGIAAIRDGEPVIAQTVERYRAARDHLCAQLADLPGVKFAPPAGAMYLFFSIETGMDSLTLCKRLVAEAGLGIAPGAAFGPEGEGYVRWCIASGLPRLDEGVRRLKRFLAGL